MSDAATRFDLSGDERKLLAFAHKVAAPYADHQGPLPFAALVEGLSPSLPLLGNQSVQRYLHDFGSPAQCKRFLPGLLSGDAIGAIPISEARGAAGLAAGGAHAPQTRRG